MADHSHLPPQDWIDAAPTRAVIAALEAAGGADCARFVGGCVRDALLGRTRADQDIDIATRLTPEETTAALKRAGLRAIPTGVEHGTITAIADHRPFEITTLRRDVETDGRRAVVAFTQDWNEDAARRDFRLNALYAEADGRLHDPTGGGIADALAGRIVFVGEPEIRIREDYLRILRFFRFHAWYGQGEPDAAALAACSDEVRLVSWMSPREMRRALYRLGPKAFKDRVKLAWAASDRTATYVQWRMLYVYADAWSPPPFPLDGAEIKAAGVPEGPLVGQVRREVEDWWIDLDFTDDKMAVLERLKAVAQGLAY